MRISLESEIDPLQTGESISVEQHFRMGENTVSSKSETNPLQTDESISVEKHFRIGENKFKE